MIGPKRPVPRENLTTGVLLFADDGETLLGEVTDVWHGTIVTLDGPLHEQPMKVHIDRESPAPIVADMLPDAEDPPAPPVVHELPTDG